MIFKNFACCIIIDCQIFFGITYGKDGRYSFIKSYWLIGLSLWIRKLDEIQNNKLSLRSKFKNLYLIPNSSCYPSSQSVLFAWCGYNLSFVYFQICYYPFCLYFMQFLKTFQLCPYRPYLYHPFTTATCENVALFYAVQCSYPALMRARVLINRLLLSLAPQIYSSILRSWNKLVFIYASDSINCVIMTLKYHLCLFLCFPHNILVIISWGNKIICINVINIQHFCVVSIIGLNNSSLGAIPLLHCPVSTNRT